MTTPKLAMAELSASQATKEVTHNDALRVIDALVQTGIQDKDLTTPPSHAHGNCWIVAASATGAWSGMAGKIAQSYNSAWYFLTPKEGWRVWVNDENATYVYDGAAWVVQDSAGSAGFVGQFTRVGSAASGNVAYTGIGFTPSRITFFYNTQSDFVSVGWGFTDGVRNATNYRRNDGPQYIAITTACIAVYYDGADISKSQSAVIASMDADGFTLAWTKGAGSSANTAYISFLAER